MPGPPQKVKSDYLDITSLNDRREVESVVKSAHTLEKLLEERKYQEEISETEEYYDWGKELAS